jgi:hypothetical protein
LVYDLGFHILSFPDNAGDRCISCAETIESSIYTEYDKSSGFWLGLSLLRFFAALNLALS